MMSLQPDLDFDLDTGEKYYAYIARGENSTLTARTNKALADYRKTIQWDTETVYNTLFTDPDAAKKLIPDAVAFQNAIYDCARVSDPFDIPDNMFRYLPFGNVVRFHELNFLSAYLNQCDSAREGARRHPHQPGRRRHLRQGPEGRRPVFRPRLAVSRARMLPGSGRRKRALYPRGSGRQLAPVLVLPLRGEPADDFLPQQKIR